MKRFAIGVVVGLVLGLAVAAGAQRADLTGQAFNKWPKFARLGYVSGYWHGIAQGALEPKKVSSISLCTVNWTTGQVQAVVEKYLAGKVLGKPTTRWQLRQVVLMLCPTAKYFVLPVIN